MEIFYFEKKVTHITKQNATEKEGGRERDRGTLEENERMRATERERESAPQSVQSREE